jgi:hypothetical protein
VLCPTMMLAADEVWSTNGGGATPVMTRRHANGLSSILGAALEAEWCSGSASGDFDGRHPDLRWRYPDGRRRPLRVLATSPRHGDTFRFRA